MLETTNLQLLPIELIHTEAVLRDKEELANLLGVSVPEGWPQFPEAFSLHVDTSHTLHLLQANWHGYFFIHLKERVLVGNGGFKGPPGNAGTVEIGYEIAPAYWNRGFATEAVQGLLAYAFSHEEVKAVMAHTLAQVNASNRVLQKVGMQFIAEVVDPEDGQVWQWQIKRNRYHSLT